MIVPFTKMHGIGNDFILVNESDLGADTNIHQFAVAVCHRHFGVGADGLMVNRKSYTADARMDYYNSDGSMGEMCGNGIRCFARFVGKNQSEDQDSISIETTVGIKRLTVKTVSDTQSLVSVLMGQPLVHTYSEKITMNGVTFDFSYLSMGVPHVVIFIDKLDETLTDTVGPFIEKHERFPQGTNVNFCHIIDSQKMKVFTWERGAGHTLACGTGVTSAFAMAVELKSTDRQMIVQAEGGHLDMKMDENKDITMTGFAQDICRGYYLYEVD